MTSDDPKTGAFFGRNGKLTLRHRGQSLVYLRGLRSGNSFQFGAPSENKDFHVTMFAEADRFVMLGSDESEQVHTAQRHVFRLALDETAIKQVDMDDMAVRMAAACVANVLPLNYFGTNPFILVGVTEFDGLVGDAPESGKKWELALEQQLEALHTITLKEFCSQRTYSGGLVVQRLASGRLAAPAFVLRSDVEGQQVIGLARIWAFYDVAMASFALTEHLLQQAQSQGTDRNRADAMKLAKRTVEHFYRMPEWARAVRGSRFVQGPPRTGFISSRRV